MRDRLVFFPLSLLIQASLAMAWIALFDNVAMGSTTHPPAWERVERTILNADVGPLSEGKLVAAWLIKTVFNPDAETSVVDNPRDLFRDALIDATRGPR